MSRQGPRSDDVKRKVAELVGRGLTYAQAGGAHGVSESTVVRWFKEPEVQRIAEEERQQTMDPTALGVLRAALQSKNEAIRIRAAALLLQNTDQTEDEEPDAIPGRVVQVF